MKKRIEVIKGYLTLWIDYHRYHIGVAILFLFIIASWWSTMEAKLQYEEYSKNAAVAEAMVAKEELNKIAIEKANETYELQLLQKQIIVAKDTEDIVVVYNASEMGFQPDHLNALITWAKDHGHDGIVIGRISESSENTRKMFSTWNGQNEVPLKYVVESVRKNGCEDVVSFMSNEINFGLPYPFTDQVYGKMEIYTSNGISFAGVDITDPKTKIRSSNFLGVIEDGAINGGFSTSWDRN